MNTSIAQDMAALQIAPQATQQRINDSYEYDGESDGNMRSHYHFATSPAISAQSPLSQLNLTQAPLKSKTPTNQTPARGSIPAVRIGFFCPARFND